MKDEILSYLDMCSREHLSLQRGMNFRAPPGISIVLMSQRRGAPYQDSLSSDGTILIYEGHDENRSYGVDPKSVDQPWRTSSGRDTENARFANACGKSTLVRVYEKLRDGIWSDKGLFLLKAYEYVFKPSERRKVFKFSMGLSDQEAEGTASLNIEELQRVIPSWVKQEVYKRDKGRCVLCGSADQLHFDHELPFSRGGTSVLPENVRILCARHNLSKGAKIE